MWSISSCVRLTAVQTAVAVEVKDLLACRFSHSPLRGSGRVRVSCAR